MLAIIKLIHISGLEENMSTKEKILEAALSLFAENGYDGTSVEQIANVVFGFRCRQKGGFDHE